MHFMYRNYNKNLVNYHTHVKNQRTYDVRISKSEVRLKQYATTYINTYMNYSSIPFTKVKVLKNNCLQNIPFKKNNENASMS